MLSYDRLVRYVSHMWYLSCEVSSADVYLVVSVEPNYMFLSRSQKWLFPSAQIWKEVPLATIESLVLNNSKVQQVPVPPIHRCFITGRSEVYVTHKDP